MIRKIKKYSWPRKLYDATRIKDENVLVEQFGLKNKREIWKAEAKVKYFRQRAKDLINATHEEQETFFAKLRALGFDVKTVADVLALAKEDLLNRRLATIVFKRGLAKTPQQARQMIVHRKVTLGERIVNVPGYLVRVEEESHIKVHMALPVAKKKVEEVTEDDSGTD